MLKVSNAVKAFADVRALDGLDMSVPRGAVYGLVGPNGAGKTTVLRCAVGAYKPDEGSIELAGEPVWDNVSTQNRFFFIPDEPYFYPQSSLKQMADFYSRIYPRFDKDRYNKLGEAFSFDDKRPLRSLSRGMRKQAAFRLALAARPELLILDEPVDGLDPVMRRQVWSLVMGDMAENDMTVLVSSHNLRELEDVCSHVGIIHKGKMVLQRPLEELQENVVKLQLVRPDTAGEESPLPENIEVLHREHSGRLNTLIVRCDPRVAEAAAIARGAVYAEAVPLTLEEIFVYEMGGSDYAVKDILL